MARCRCRSPGLCSPGLAPRPQPASLPLRAPLVAASSVAPSSLSRASDLCGEVGLVGEVTRGCILLVLVPVSGLGLAQVSRVGATAAGPAACHLSGLWQPLPGWPPCTARARGPCVPAPRSPAAPTPALLSSFLLAVRSGAICSRSQVSFARDTQHSRVSSPLCSHPLWGARCVAGAGCLAGGARPLGRACRLGPERGVLGAPW